MMRPMCFMQVDLWRCVEESDCTFNSDERLQLAVMRDPRAVTVSTYFYLLRKNPELLKSFDFSLDTFFQRSLETTCMWTNIRHLLFTKLLADKSKAFVFEDMLLDSVDWYGWFFPFIGLEFPVDVIFEIAQSANERSGRGINEHPGGRKAGGNQTFLEELGPESLAMMDDVVRVWLPPILLQSFGIPPQSST